MQWRCSRDGPVTVSQIEAEAGLGGKSVAMSCLPAAMVPKPAPLPEGTIDVVEATYGGNCGAVPGNASTPASAACRGKTQCAFPVDATTLGDPAGGCPKDFSVQWRCSRDGMVTVSQIEAEAGLGGKSVAMSCLPSRVP